jgi:hypothetical protein
MSYQKKIEEMVGEHVAIFQQEYSLAREMAGLTRKGPAMPYGYPLAVYRPIHFCKIPQVRHFIARTGGCLSNGVPRVLSMDFVDNHLLGIYNRRSAA